MKKLKFINYIYVILALLILCISACMVITSIEQPSTAAVGEDITVKVNVHMKPEQNNNNFLVFSVLTPKAWNIRSNATASFASDWDFGDGFPATGNMRIAGSDFAANPEDEAKGIDGSKNGLTWSEEITSRIGIGENYGDVEWVTFISENKIKVREDDDWFGGEGDTEFDGVITLNLTVGDGHTKTQLGYLIGNANHGLKVEDPPRDDGKGEKHFDFQFTDCMTITGAAGDATDLCGPAPTNLVKIIPEGFLFNDLITIQFDAKEGDGGPTALLNAGAVFLCATAVFADGSTKEVCPNNDSAKMILTGGNIWEITIWPRGYFGVQAGQVITELQMNFQNQDGSIIVRNPTGGRDVTIVPICN